MIIPPRDNEFIGPYPLSILNNAISYVHLSYEWLGHRFTLTPRIPRYPYETDNDWVIEDTQTPRVSLATSIKDALNALGEGQYVNYYIYVPRNDTSTFIPFGETRPSSPGNPYGPDFSVTKYLSWIDEKEYPRPTDKEISDLFIYLVPDALQTGEVWALDPVDTINLGRMKNNNFYMAPWLHKKTIKQQGGKNVKRAIKKSLQFFVG